MKKNIDLSRLFSKGQELETSLATRGYLEKDNGLHIISFKITLDKKVTVIDNVSVYGNTILIIESKNFKGIKGNLNDAFWRGKGVRKAFSILNPINQNNYHERMLRGYLYAKGLSPNDYNIQTYVVVPDACDIQVDEPSRAIVVRHSQINKIKGRLSFYNSEVDANIGRVLKEGI